jgi:hypothetical protein
MPHRGNEEPLDCCIAATRAGFYSLAESAFTHHVPGVSAKFPSDAYGMLKGR